MNDEQPINDLGELDAVIDNSTDECLEFKNQARDFQKGWQRAMADYDNLKKEMTKKIEESGQFHEANLFKEILPIYELFGTALDHVETEAKQQAWYQGLEQINKIFTDFINSHQIKKIATVGQEYNPHFHQAVSLQDSDLPEHQIIQEVKSGWLQQEAVLIPALVVVSNGLGQETKQGPPLE